MSTVEILDFSPFGFAAKADASGVDLKVRYAQDDRNHFSTSL